MYETLKIKNKEITKQDIEDYYDMLGDKDFDYFNDKVGASSMWSAIEDSVEYDDSENDFINRLKNMNLIDVTTDIDALEKARRLYEKYVI